jgi:hypothetical protein
MSPIEQSIVKTVAQSIKLQQLESEAQTARMVKEAEEFSVNLVSMLTPSIPNPEVTEIS